MDKLKALIPYLVGAVLAVIAVVSGINYMDALGIVTSPDSAKAFCDAIAAKGVSAP